MSNNCNNTKSKPLIYCYFKNCTTCRKCKYKYLIKKDVSGLCNYFSLNYSKIGIDKIGRNRFSMVFFFSVFLIIKKKHKGNDKNNNLSVSTMLNLISSESMNKKEGYSLRLRLFFYKIINFHLIVYYLFLSFFFFFKNKPVRWHSNILVYWF